MKIIVHQTHHSIADFDGIYEYIKKTLKSPSASSNTEGVHLFPELFLTGYPLQDLCLQKSFIDSYLQFLNRLDQFIQEECSLKNSCLLLGGLEYQLTEAGIPKTIKNVIYQYSEGITREAIYTKRLLPNYDIFDEQKYFTKGSQSIVLDLFGNKIGLLICEDMWNSSFHSVDPVEELYKKVNHDKIQLDGIFNLSASPFIVGKQSSRIDRAIEISQYFGCPFYYVNRVGAEDEILFDGQSFCVSADKIIAQGKRFMPEVLSLELSPKNEAIKAADRKHAVTWEELFKAQMNFEKKPAILHEWSDDQCQEVIEALCFGFQDYASKNGFDKFSIALSGGMDSALVLTLIKMSLKKEQTLEAIYMPSTHSSSLSYDLSFDLCQKLGTRLTTLPIKFLHSTTKNLFGQTFDDKFEGLTDENVQSRLRGLLIYTRSNQVGSMVVNTSNKSEIAVGYSTQYGDSVGAISLLGDIYKSQVYRLAEYINTKYNNPIPQQIITRPPTAELCEGQIDTDSLPPYEILDAILEGILSYRYSQSDLCKLGFNEEYVNKTFGMYARNEYKRYQFCPIIKINSKSFGFGYRIPLSKNVRFYDQL